LLLKAFDQLLLSPLIKRKLDDPNTLVISHLSSLLASIDLLISVLWNQKKKERKKKKKKKKAHYHYVYDCYREKSVLGF
jgi:hypothetical protein